MAFSFSLTPRVTDWRDRIADFILRVVVPHEQEASELGVSDGLRRTLQAAARDAGIWAPAAPAELGGGGFRFDEVAVLLEEAGTSLLGPLALNCAAPDEGNVHLLDAVSTPAQRDKYLRPLVAGQIRSCFAMTEPVPGAGSDPAALRARARLPLRPGPPRPGPAHALYALAGRGTSGAPDRAAACGAPGTVREPAH